MQHGPGRIGAGGGDFPVIAFAGGVIAGGMAADRDAVGQRGDNGAHRRQQLFGVGHRLGAALLEHGAAVLVHQLDAQALRRLLQDQLV